MIDLRYWNSFFAFLTVDIPFFHEQFGQLDQLLGLAGAKANNESCADLLFDYIYLL